MRRPDIPSVMMHFNDRLDEHVGNLYQAINRNDEKSLERHEKTCKMVDTLSDTVKVLAERRVHNSPCESLKTAIFKEDFEAHRDTHEADEARKADNADLFKKIKAELAKYAIVGVTLYLSSLIWRDAIEWVHAALGAK